MMCGVVYVAYGEKFVKEASVSALSVRRTNPSLKTCLVTDEPSSPDGFDEVLVRPLSKSHVDKVFAWDAPFERARHRAARRECRESPET